MTNFKYIESIENIMKTATQVLLVCGLATGHFFLSFFVSFAAGISGGAWRIASKIIMFPLSLLPDTALPNLSPAMGWVLWIAVSFGWALAVFYGIRALQK